MVEIQCVSEVGSELGEGPIWVDDAGRVEWVDIEAGRVTRTWPDLSVDDRVQRLPGKVSLVVPTRQGRRVVCLDDRVEVRPVGESGHLDEPSWSLQLFDDPEVRCNDGAVDAEGNLWIGTMRRDATPGGGQLYRLCGRSESDLETVLTGVGISNGLDWSPDGAVMYYVDSLTRRIDQFDVRDGQPVRRRMLAEVEPPALPDGLVVDDDGCIWVALWDGGSISRFTPDGALDRRVELPVSRPTSLVFGGPRLETLFVTTASIGLAPTQLAEQELAGRLLAIEGVGTGRPANRIAWA